MIQQAVRNFSDMPNLARFSARVEADAVSPDPILAGALDTLRREQPVTENEARALAVRQLELVLRALHVGERPLARLAVLDALALTRRWNLQGELDILLDIGLGAQLIERPEVRWELLAVGRLREVTEPTLGDEPHPLHVRVEALYLELERARAIGGQTGVDDLIERLRPVQANSPEYAALCLALVSELRMAGADTAAMKLFLELERGWGAGTTAGCADPLFVCQLYLEGIQLGRSLGGYEGNDLEVSSLLRYPLRADVSVEEVRVLAGAAATLERRLVDEGCREVAPVTACRIRFESVLSRIRF